MPTGTVGLVTTTVAGVRLRYRESVPTAMKTASVAAVGLVRSMVKPLSFDSVRHQLVETHVSRSGSRQSPRPCGRTSRTDRNPQTVAGHQTHILRPIIAMRTSGVA